MSYTVQQVAQLTGLSEHTLRYYEQIGLIAPVPRATNGHRRYTEEDVTRIRFLNKMRATGMSIKQMVQYVQAATEERLSILQGHYAEIQAQIAELQTVAGMIEWKMGLYEARLMGQEDIYLGRESHAETHHRS